MARVTYFEIFSKDPEKSGRFYQEVFGWHPREVGGTLPYLRLEAGPPEVSAIDGAILGPHFSQAVVNTIEVDSLPAALERIEKAGGRKLHGPRDIPSVGIHAYCADSEGQLFGIVEPFR